MRGQGLLRRAVAGAVAASALFPAATLMASPAAAAVTCGPSTNGATYVTTAVTTKNITWTHNLVVATVAAHGSATRTLTVAKQLTASVTVSTGVEAEAGVIFASAKASVGFSLKAEGSRTDTDSISATANNTTSSIKDYVFFDGTKRGVGTWKLYKCQYDGHIAEWLYRVVGTGNWDSWNIQFYGVLDCDTDSAVKTKYGSFSVQYAAVASC